jgi:hypothetical protein
VLEYLLTIMFYGSTLTEPIVMRTDAGCEDLGAKLVQIVKDTEPNRGKQLTYTCTEVLAQDPDGKVEP